MTSPSVAILGMGKMGLTHAAILEVLHPGCVKAALELDSSLHPILRSMGLRAAFYTDPERMLEEQSLDAAFVCTPTFTHFDLTQRLLRQGIAVLVEKPLAESLDRCEALAATAAELRIPAAVGYSVDCDPVFSEARRLLGESALGRVRHFRAWVEHAEVFGPKKGWLFQPEKSGGGVVINPSPHMLFVLLEAFGVPQELSARLRSPYSRVEDEALVEFRYADGLEGTLWASWSVPGKPTLELALLVEGDNGLMAASAEELLLELRAGAAGMAAGSHRLPRAQLEAGKPAFELAPQAFTGNYFRQDRDFLERCLKGLEPRNSIAGTLRVDRMIAAIYRSAREHGPVPWTS